MQASGDRRGLGAPIPIVTVTAAGPAAGMDIAGFVRVSRWAAEAALTPSGTRGFNLVRRYSAGERGIPRSESGPDQ